MKQNSQSRKGVKSSIRRRIQQTRYYYQRKLTHHYVKIIRNRVDMAFIPQISPEERNLILIQVSEIFEMVRYVLENKLENERYMICIREKYRKLMKFLSKLESVGYLIKEYIHAFGTDEFVTEKMALQNSPKISEALENARQDVGECERYKN